MEHGGDLWHRDFGDGWKRTDVRFNFNGHLREPGTDHYSVHGDGAHYSWNQFQPGDPRWNLLPGDRGGMNVHGTLHNPHRPW